MSRSLFAALGIATLTACVPAEVPLSVPLPAGFVPFQQVLVETADTPYECTAYRSGSCEAIAIHSGEGSMATSTATALILDEPTINLVLSADYRLTSQGLLCDGGSPVRSRIDGNVPPAIRDVMAETVQVFVDAYEVVLRETCVAYLRDGAPGRYRIVGLFPDGSPASLEENRVRFYANQPPLRRPAQ